MGTEKPDDNKGKGKSILESNDPINDKDKPPASSTPPGTSNLQSDAYVSGSSTFLANDGSSAFFGHTTPNLQSDAYVSGSSTLLANDGSSAFFGHTTSNLQSDAYAGQSSASGSENSTSLALSLAAQTGNYQQHQAQVEHVQHPTSSLIDQQSSSGQVPPLPTFGHSKIPRGTGIQIGESFFFTPIITNQTPLAAQQHNLWGTHQTGNYQQHQGQVGHVHQPTPSLIRDFLASQGYPSTITYIIGQPSDPRKRARDESSPPVGSSPPVVLQGDSSQPLQPSGNKCMLCTKVLKEQEGMHTCGHFYHDECLQKILHAWHSKNHPCIQCLINAWLSILVCQYT